MRPQGFIPATFSLTARAVAKIDQLRRDLELRKGERIGAVGFAWGHVQLKDGSKFENPVIGFYESSQMDATARASVQTVDGIDLIVFSTPEQATNFDDRVVDFVEDRGFFIAE